MLYDDHRALRERGGLSEALRSSMASTTDAEQPALTGEAGDDHAVNGLRGSSTSASPAAEDPSSTVAPADDRGFYGRRNFRIASRKVSGRRLRDGKKGDGSSATNPSQPHPPTAIAIPSPGAVAAEMDMQAVDQTPTPGAASSFPVSAQSSKSFERLERSPSARTRLRSLLRRPHHHHHHHHHADKLQEEEADTPTSAARPAGALDPSSPLAHHMIGASAVAPSFGGDPQETTGVPLLTTVLAEELDGDLTPSTEVQPVSQANKEDEEDGKARAKAAPQPAVPIVVQSTAEVKTMAVALSTDSVPAVQQKPNIKVRIITWNMHDSIPKGDLEVLLGRVGPYIAPEPGWDIAANSEVESDAEAEAEEGTGEEAEQKKELREQRKRRRGKAVVGQEDVPRKDRIPTLPYDDAHPFHVLIVAGQEAPFGDGRRLATGVGLAGELSDLSRNKSKAVHKKERRDVKKEEGHNESPSQVSSTATSPSGGEGSEGIGTKAGQIKVKDHCVPPVSAGLEDDMPQTPLIPGTPGIGGKVAPSTLWGIGGKGWSEVCEDWYCRGAEDSRKGESAFSAPLSGLNTPLGSSSAIDLPISPVTPGISPPDVSLAASPPKGRAKDGLAANGGAKLAVPKPAFMTRSNSNVSLTEMVTAAYSNTNELTKSASADLPSLKPNMPTPRAQDMNRKHDLHLNIPDHIRGLQTTVEHDKIPPSLGPYELVTKERMMGCYIACYVWRGCLDRVQGVSRGHVKSGLLAGRVGNKGGCAVGLKLGQTRLLFVK